MAKLSDYGINVDNLNNSTVVTVRGVELPVSFTMATMEFIADVYGADYSKFEADMNKMLSKKEGEITSADLLPSDLKIMRALVYGMIRTGGLEETPETIFKFLGMNGEVVSIYAVCMQIYADQMFQVEDLKKSNKPQDFQNPRGKRKKNKKNQKR